MSWPSWSRRHSAIFSAVVTMAVFFTLLRASRRSLGRSSRSRTRRRRTLTGSAVGEVGDPFPVGSRRREVPVEQVRRPPTALVSGDRGAVIPPRTSPDSPSSRISRSIVQAATRWPWRRRWAVIFRRPYMPSGVFTVARNASVRYASVTARSDGRAVFQFRYVRGATWTPCSVSTRQIDSTRQ